MYTRQPLAADTDLSPRTKHLRLEIITVINHHSTTGGKSTAPYFPYSTENKRSGEIGLNENFLNFTNVVFRIGFLLFIIFFGGMIAGHDAVRTCN